MRGKPLYSVQKYLTYQKHKARLEEIASKPIKASDKGFEQIQKMHQIRNKSFSFQKKEKKYKLDIENQKLLEKIVEITQKKPVPNYTTISSSHITNTEKQKEKSMILFNNPVRKRRQEEIVKENEKLVQRLLTKESNFDRNKTNKQVQDYYKLKAILRNNRKRKNMYFAKSSIRMDSLNENSQFSTIQKSENCEEEKSIYERVRKHTNDEYDQLY